MKAGAEHCVPIEHHGDGGSVTKRSEFLLLHWFSVAVPSSPSNLCLYTVFAMDYWGPESGYVLDAYLSWSFRAMGAGKHPSVDPWGVPLQDSMPELAEWAGQPLAGPWRAAWHGMCRA